MSKHRSNHSRRDFLRFGAKCGLGAAGMWALRDLELMASAVGAPASGVTGYKALVCVFLYGGNDSFNLVVPTSTTEYDAYADARQNLAIERDALLPILPLTDDGATYGVHPSCPEMQTLFSTGKLAFLANCGTLVAPMTKTQYQNDTVPKPPQLYSHSDQQFQWQTGVADSIDNVGWCGRTADAMPGVNGSSPLATCISLSGANTLQIGQQSLPYNLGTNGAIKLNGLFDSWNEDRTLAFESILDHAHEHRMVRQYASIQRQAIDLQSLIQDALDASTPLVTIFPTSGLGRQLQMVARMIAIRASLGMSRQIFFVSTGGFDTHDNQNQDQPALFQNLSRSLSAFQASLEELGVGDLVTTFTGSDFGRTLTSNGDGSDHGWGSHQLVMGGAVRGGDLYGTMPSFAMGGPDDVGGGRLLPTTSVDEYSATLAQWFGLSGGEIATVLPNLGNFAHPDLGFMT